MTKAFQNVKRLRQSLVGRTQGAHFRVVGHFHTTNLRRFTIRQQVPQQLPIPFEEAEDDMRLQAARQRLAELEIRDLRLIEEIINDPQKVNQRFNFVHKLKTGKTTATTNAGGLFLTMIGLREAKSKPANRSVSGQPAGEKKRTAKRS